MLEIIRETGIDILGSVPWGTHFCQFYQTKDDLIDILVPYFRAGLENNEFCMWITSEPLRVEDAKRSLKKVVQNLDDYFEKGQIEILDYSQWYTKSGRFEAKKVLHGWIEKEEQAIKKGFDGLRLTGNTLWLEKKDWENFTDYEEEINNAIGQQRMIAICSYSLNKCGTFEVIDVVKNHQFALIKREGTWEQIESSDRKKVEDELQKIFELSVDMICIADIDGYFRKINPSFRKILGYSDEELLAKPFLDFVHPDDKTPTLKVIKDNLTQGIPVINFENRYRCKDNSYKWLMWTSKPIPEQGITYAIARDITAEREIAAEMKKYRNHLEELVTERTSKLVTANAKLQLEITERKKTDEALKASEEKYRTLAENAMDAIYIISTESGFEYINQAFEKIFGYKSEELCLGNLNFLDIVHPDDRKLIEKRKEARTKGKELPSLYGFRGITKKGDIKHVEVNTVALPGKGNRVLGILRDVTEHKNAEMMLKESELELRKQKIVLEQKNIALREVIAQVEEEKRRIKDDIEKNVDILISPILEKLKMKETNLEIANLLQYHLERLSSSFGSKITNIKLNLTPKEIEVCNMVKSGLTNKEISNLLNISYKTVKTHRTSIRRKLGLAREQINLTSFLREL
jgi:PAS domain S-box-containing protein